MVAKAEGSFEMNEAPTMSRNALRREIVKMVVRGQNGHIPSAFSIVDIVEALYDKHLNVRANDPDWPDRDYFLLSKGHGCVALYAVLHQHGFLTDSDLELFCKKGGILGEHPDMTKVPGAEASSGSLGHGLPFGAGIALGLQIQKKSNRVFVLCGDGECHEGTIWETAHVARNRQLGNLCVIVDWNQSGQQLLPIDDLPAKWSAFGWKTLVVNGHCQDELHEVIENHEFNSNGVPLAIIAQTVKGKGVPMLEGHGPWHHRIPSMDELAIIEKAL